MNNKIFITCVEIRNHENCFSIKIARLRTCNSRVAFNDKSVGQPNMLRSFNLQLTAFLCKCIRLYIVNESFTVLLRIKNAKLFAMICKIAKTNGVINVRVYYTIAIATCNIEHRQCIYNFKKIFISE